MLQYQKAISAAETQVDQVQKTIPEELFAIHPKILYEEMPAILEDCENIQKHILQEILSLAKGSCYAQDHESFNTESWQQWRKSAEITTYKDYQPYIEAEMQGNNGQLYSGETVVYTATTGSTGKIKYFLESKAGDKVKQLVMAVRGMYMSALLPVTLDMEAKNLTISNYAPVGTNPDGKLIVRASGQTARNMRKKTGTMNILPVEFWESPGISAKDRDYMMGVYVLSEVRFSKVFCNNVIHFGRILDRIIAEGQQMITDIRNGIFSVDLQPHVREQLAQTFQANPARADYLQKLYENKGCLITAPEDIAAIWPSFSMISCWLSASVGRDAREVLRRLPAEIKCFELGYGASECKLNIPTKLASAAGVAAPFACFYEFRPVGSTELLCMWEVTQGAYYELIVTTYSGLYRYNMQDIVCVEGFVGKTPQIVFCGKSSEFMLANGHKIYGYQFAELLHRAERQHQVEFDFVQVYTAGDKFYYVLESKDEVDFAQLKKDLDNETEKVWGVTSQGIYVMKHSYKNYQFTARTREDRGACGIKLPIMVQECPVESEVEKIIL